MQRPLKGQPPTADFPTPTPLDYEGPSGRRLEVGWRRRIAPLAFTFATCALMLIVLVVGGHGGGPVIYILTAGSMDAWGEAISFFWAGVLLQSATLFIRGLGPRMFAHTSGIACVVLSWGTIAIESEAPEVTLLTSLPFLAALLSQIVHLILRFRSERRQCLT